ncbi:MAG: hypothetical protein IJR25_07020 [Bacteroidales bacterium]|nr:hypothetical protein [Bacteroidales bacterium]
MKKLFYSISILLSIAALFASCKRVEDSDQYKQLLVRVDSLNRVNKQIKADYNETLDMLNEIEAGFNEISAAESSLIALNLENQGDTISRKEIMLNQVDKIKDKIAQQQQKIDDLQAQLSKSSAKNRTLTATIARMQQELDEKTLIIEDLQRTVSDQRNRINELGNTVASLEKDVAGLKEKSADQLSRIKSQDTDLNTVHYICGTESELVAWNLFEKKGLFDGGRLLDISHNDADFKTFDRRRVSVVPTNGKRLKLLTNHPDGSYTIEPEEDGTESIVITDKDSFWSISRYLVVRVKR